MAEKKEKNSEKNRADNANEGQKAAASGDTDDRSQTPPAPEESPSGPHRDFDGHFPIVGIGASAGGVHALEEFFSEMPSDCGMAFIVMQHLSPKHESHMRSLLSKKTQMEIFDAEDGMEIRPNRIYLGLPDKDLIIEDGHLRVKTRTREDGMTVSIDVLFRSLAQELEQYAICVVLTGAGADGTQGAKEVKGQGGLVVAQDPDQAQYRRMPQSVVDAGLADLVLPVKEIPAELQRYIHHPFINGGKKAKPDRDQAEHTEDTDKADEASEQEADDKFIPSILTLVRTHTGHDFSHYKRNTIRRRIQRRMALHHIRKISEYRRFLRQDPDEVESLFEDMTITVTGFFRDREVYDRLKSEALEPLMREKDNHSRFRIWVPGCATGEEAYSLAIVLLETMEELEKYFEIKIFASDINEPAINTARNGVFPRGIAADITPERLKRFFVQNDDHYQVDSKIRDMVVFANHNMVRDPPFSNLDLISCRNLLIYMDGDLQKQIFPVFHYALQPGGYLLLGTSESPGDQSRFFTPVDKKHKIFRRSERAQVQIPAIRTRQETPDAGQAPRPEPDDRYREDAEAPPEGDARRLFESAVLKKYGQSAVLIDHLSKVRFFHGRAGRYLVFPEGEADLDIMKLTSGELHYRLSKTLRQVWEGKGSARLENVQVRRNDHFLRVDVALTRLQNPKGGRSKPWALIEFEEARQPEPAEGETEPQTSTHRGRLEEELHSTRQELQATIEELETSNEELKSANEELQANNEELQSTNEELESSKEELQSTNEELETVNSELYKKNQELTRAEDNMNNLFSAIDNRIILLDDDLRIQRFTDAATELFKLKEVDRGRALSDITGTIDYRSLEEDAREVLDTLSTKKRTFRSLDGRKEYRVRITPYRTRENVIEGVIMAFSDITEQSSAERESRKAAGTLNAALEALWEPVLLLNESFQVIRSNPAFHALFKVSSDEILNRSLFTIGGDHWNTPDIRRFLEGVLERDESYKGLTVEKEFPRIGPRKIALTGRRLPEDEARKPMILLGFKDVAEGGQPRKAGA